MRAHLVLVGRWALVFFLGHLAYFSHAHPRLAAARDGHGHGHGHVHGRGDALYPPRSEPTKRKLKGRFLHITDIHPDPFYKAHSATDEAHACHRGKGEAGVYGAETTDCDSPYALVNATFAWINEHLKDEVDFVVWTGDNARHDNDEDLPRTRHQVIAQNQFIVSKFLEVWGKPENYDDDDPTNDFTIPIVPTLGNNDILPHNIFLEGPNFWTRRYLDMWAQFVPEAQRHQFQQGGWFWTEVIPDRLAVVSLNTLYFFRKNAGVEGCALKSEPGYEHFDWLRVQLELFRSRGVKALLMGHVPPARTESKVSWDETCWQKYALWMESYRDVIVGSLYGHMNIDHFILLDFKHIKKSTRKGAMKEEKMEKQDFDVLGAKRSYLVELRDAWSESVSLFKGGVGAMKKGKHGKEKDKFWDGIGGQFAERYAISHVNPSVIPNYFPTLRVFEYNITGLDDAVVPVSEHSQTLRVHVDTPQQILSRSTTDDELDDVDELDEARPDGAEANKAKAGKKKKKKGGKKKKIKKHKFRLPSAPSKSAPPGPAYSPQTLSLTGFTQYYANLTYINNEFSLVAADELARRQAVESGVYDAELANVEKKKKGPNGFAFEVEYRTQEDDMYGMADLSVRSYIELASKIVGKRVEDVFEEADDGDESVGGRGDETDDEVDEVDEDGYGTDDEHGVVGDDRHSVDTIGRGKHDGKRGEGMEKKEEEKTTNKVWLKFVERAFVSSLDPTTIEEYFGNAEPAVNLDAHDDDEWVSVRKPEAEAAQSDGGDGAMVAGSLEL